MTSLWPRIEPLLAQVSKPARYIGGELGAQRPEHGPERVAWLLIYPDTYEIGLPNQGLQILYEILNERPDAVAERAYAPWTDMEAAMRAAGVPLFSLEATLPAGDFDVLAFNLSAELTYTNVLNLVDLAGVPVRSAERTSADPLVHRRWALRLQPRAPGRLRRRLRPGRRRGGGGGDHRGGGRVAAGGAVAPTCSARWPRSPGVYVPSCYEAALEAGRRVASVRPAVPGAPGGGEAHHRRPGRVAVSHAAARPAHRGGARPAQRRGLPGLHARVPLLPGGDDHPARCGSGPPSR